MNERLAARRAGEANSAGEPTYARMSAVRQIAALNWTGASTAVIIDATGAT